MMRIIKKNITVQLFGVITILIFLLIIANTYLATKKHLALSDNYHKKKGEFIAEILEESIRLPFFSENMGLVTSQINIAMNDPGIAAIKVFDKSKKEIVCKVRKDISENQINMIKNDGVESPKNAKDDIIEFAFRKTIETFNNPMFDTSPYFTESQISRSSEFALGYLTVYLDTNQSKIEKNEILIMNLNYGAFFWAVCCALAYMVAKRFTAPITELIEAVKKVENEGFGHIIAANVYKDNEMGRLIEAFNHMSITIDKRQKEKDLLDNAVWAGGKHAILNEIRESIGNDLLKLVKMMLHYSEKIGRGTTNNESVSKDIADLYKLQLNAMKLLIDLNSHGKKKTKYKEESLELGAIFRAFEISFNKRLPEQASVSVLMSDDFEEYSVVAKAKLCEVLKKICIFMVLRSDQLQKGKISLSMKIGTEIIPRGHYLNAPAGRYCTIRLSRESQSNESRVDQEQLYEPYFSDIYAGVGTSLTEIKREANKISGILTVTNSIEKEYGLKIYLPLFSV